MKKMKVMVVIVFMIIFSDRSIAEDATRENWGNFKITKSLTNDLRANFKTELRYIGFLDHYFNYFDLGLTWKTKKWAVVSANFRHVTKRSGTEWRKEYWPYADLRLTKNMQKLSLSNRSRLEIRIKEDEDMFLYRDKIALKLPEITKGKLQPFIADDIFWDMKNFELFRNRMHVGLTCAYFENLKYALSYIFENTWKNDNRQDKNIILLEVGYEF